MKLIVEGMTCDHCVRSVTKAIRERDPHARVDVDLAAGTVRVDGVIDAGSAFAAISAEGYTVTGIVEDEADATPSSGCCGGCRT